MKLNDLIKKVGGNMLNLPQDPARLEVAEVYAGDVISDILNKASDTTLLVTNLVTPQLLKVARLMDVPGICFVNGHTPEPAVVDSAREFGLGLAVSPLA